MALHSSIKGSGSQDPDLVSYFTLRRPVCADLQNESTNYPMSQA